MRPPVLQAALHQPCPASRDKASPGTGVVWGTVSLSQRIQHVLYRDLPQGAFVPGVDGLLLNRLRVIWDCISQLGRWGHKA